MKPYLSGPIEDYIARCTYGIPEGDPNRCTNRATRHLALLAADLVELHSIAACDEHVGIARRLCGERFVQEHAYEGLCGLPGTLWSFDLNECVLDDSGRSAAGHEQAAAELVGAR